MRNAGAYNTRKNKAERFGFQSGMRSRLHCLCAGVRLCGERCTGLSCGLLAVACYFIGDEPYGPIFSLTTTGSGTQTHGTIPGTEDLKPYITAKDKSKKVAVRHSGHGDHFGSAGGNYDAFYENIR